MKTLCVAILWVTVALTLAQQPVRHEGPPHGSRGEPAVIIEGPPLAKDDAEKRVLEVLDDMDKNQRRGSMSVPTVDGRLLRVLVESLGAKTVVELGTSIGYSAMWMCLGLRKTGGHLTTYEIDPERVNKARMNFKRAGLEDLVTIVEGDAHETLKEFKGTIDLVFLDADKEGYLNYLNTLLPMVRPGGLIVAHNMTPRQADPRYVKAVTTNPDLETVFINKGAGGIGITLKKR